MIQKKKLKILPKKLHQVQMKTWQNQLLNRFLPLIRSMNALYQIILFYRLMNFMKSKSSLQNMLPVSRLIKPIFEIIFTIYFRRALLQNRSYLVFGTLTLPYAPDLKLKVSLSPADVLPRSIQNYQINELQAGIFIPHLRLSILSISFFLLPAWQLYKNSAKVHNFIRTLPY